MHETETSFFGVQQLMPSKKRLTVGAVCFLGLIAILWVTDNLRQYTLAVIAFYLLFWLPLVWYAEFRSRHVPLVVLSGNEIRYRSSLWGRQHVFDLDTMKGIAWSGDNIGLRTATGVVTINALELSNDDREKVTEHIRHFLAAKAVCSTSNCPSY